MSDDLTTFKHSKRVLDVGCGSGRFLERLGNRGVGVDGSRDCVEHCRRNGLTAYHLNLPARLPFDDALFDGVYCSHLIEHFSPHDAFQILSEIDRVLSVGGVLLIKSPIFSRAFFDDPTHVRPYHLHCVFHLLGGWQQSVHREMIYGFAKKKYELVTYSEERTALYVPTVAPSISPGKFPFRLALRGISRILAKFGVGRKGRYSAVLRKLD